ncbi:MAG TPA: putative Ig domain-containing protein, partial [Solirubrobacteraceae bacterium]|nr:putative Ig domain-containing protein [Solirubrobacteraceae bacterium]
MTLLLATALLCVSSASSRAATHAGEILGLGAGGLGELGPATSAPVNASPVEVTLPGEIGGGRVLATGLGFSLVTSGGGQLFGFGDDVNGEAGLPGYESLQPPLEIPLPGASAAPSALAAGASSSFAATASGQLFSWGWNESGILGRGAGTEKRVLPGAVTLPGAVGGIASVATGGATLVATTSGQLFSFGENKYGQLGRPEHSGTTTPTPNPGLVSLAAHVTQVAASYEFGLALTSTGDVYSFGIDDAGELGTGEPEEPNSNPHPTPAQVTFPAGAGPVTQIAVGELTAYALTASGRLFGWGEGFAHDQLGFEEQDPVWSPREIVLPGASAPIVRIGAGEEAAYALTANGVLFGWGGNENGELGSGASKFVNPTPSPIALGEGTTVDTISSGCCALHVLILVADLGVGGSLPAGLVGTPYAASVPFSGGTPPYSFSASGLPAGLAIDGSSGAISGTPVQAGGSAPVVTVTDAFGIQASGTLSLSVAPKAVCVACGVLSPSPISLASLRASLLSQLGLHGKAAKIGHVLTHGY